MNESATHDATRTPASSLTPLRRRDATGGKAVVNARMRGTLSLILLLMLVSSVLPVSADETGYRVVGNVRVYLGVIPTAMVQGKHPAAHGENLMHGGGPSGPDQYHVLIALFNAKTDERISNAKVRARVSVVGLSGEEKALESMQLAGTTTYGNFFTMKGTGLFLIRVTIRVPGAPREIDLVFQHKHQ